MNKRDIVFRGKNEDIGWVYGSLIQQELNNEYFIQVFSKQENGKAIYKNISVVKETIGQYTQLLDMRGKAIYEDDILEDIDTGEIGRVDYSFHGCPNFVVGINWVTLFIKGPDNCMKVIGNLHDNPELIKNVTLGTGSNPNEEQEI